MRRLRNANIIVWGGVGLLALGVALSASALSAYVFTHFNTPNIPTAPPPSTMDRPTQTMPAPTSTLLPTAKIQETPNASSRVAPTSMPVLPTQMPTSPKSFPLPPTIVWTGAVPTYIRIPVINLKAPVVPIDWKIVDVNGTSQATWDVPNWYAVGWHRLSAKLGVPGNTVLNGHNAGKGEVFRRLHTLEAGALILIDAEDGKTYTYRVDKKYILPEANQPLEVRIENARYIRATDDERLTLVTCHPYGSFAQRLLVIAYPTPEHKWRHIKGE